MTTNAMTVPEMFRSRTLASNIISRHGTTDDVLDGTELQLLQAFCHDPSQKRNLLVEYDMVDAPGQQLGSRAQLVHGSLVGYVISRHETPEAILRDEEIQELKAWFEGAQA